MVFGSHIVTKPCAYHNMILYLCCSFRVVPMAAGAKLTTSTDLKTSYEP